MYQNSHPYLRFVVDPTDSYTDVDPIRLVEACGLIPYWIDVTDDRSFQQQVDDSYGFGLYPWNLSKTTIDEDGTYHYEGDPDMKPYMKWERDGEVAFMYQSAIMSFIKDGEVFVTRVD